MTETFAVEWQSSQAVTAHLYRPQADHRTNRVLVLAHGAGAGQMHPFLVDFAHGLNDRGVDVVTFNFPYMEQGRRIPDRRDRLEACYAAVVRTVRDLASLDGRTLFVGGKSMGGRMATHLLAGMTQQARADIRGVVLLGYPLHPPGKPERLRSSHLAEVGVPMLVVQGDRDTFGRPDELQRALEGVERATIQVVAGGDHSFKVPARTGKSREQTHGAIQDAIVGWMHAIDDET